MRELTKKIRAIQESGVTVFPVEQNALRALGISDKAYILEGGGIAMSGKAKKLIKLDQVKKAYLNR